MSLTTLAPSLDLIGAMHGTDKSSSGHGYLHHYERLLREFRHLTFNMIEIGIDKGGSLATWYDYFDKATIIGVDIKDSCLQFQRDRVIVQIGSQDDPGFLSDLVHRYPPHIILDDGSHLAHHIIFTFERLFPSLAAGGIYIVEDLHFHAGATLELSRGYSETNPFDYFSTISRAITLNEHLPELQWGFQGYLRKHVDEVIFFGRGLAIRKKAPEAGPEARNAGILQFAERNGTVESWERASQYLRSNGSREAAITAMQSAIKIESSARLYLQLSALQLSNGDRVGAMASAQVSISQPGEAADRGYCLEHYGDMLRIESKFEQAVAAYRDALQLISHTVVRCRIEVKIKDIVAPAATSAG
jgi:hypothetical protein